MLAERQPRPWMPRRLNPEPDPSAAWWIFICIREQYAGLHTTAQALQHLFQPTIYLKWSEYTTELLFKSAQSYRIMFSALSMFGNVHGAVSGVAMGLPH